VNADAVDPVKRFFLPADYRPNTVPETFDIGNEPEYWNDERLALAMREQYQYDVYRHAMRLSGRLGADTLLDIGSGPPFKLRAMLPPQVHDVFLVDQPNTAAIAARLLPSAHFVATDLERPDVALGRFFRVIICADVVEHLLDPRPCIDLILRHLAPDGYLVISTPERDVLRGTGCRAPQHPMHVREWNRPEFRSFLDHAGFEVLSHHLLPSRRVGTLAGIFGALRSSLGRAPNWYSCQMAVCRSRSDAR
jgi:SAM-dependent methyltransferase